MVEEQISENETNTKNDFNSNITASDLNSANETISSYRMFLNYGVFLGNSLIKNLMQFSEVFFPKIGQILTLFYPFHHPVYQYIHRSF